MYLTIHRGTHEIGGTCFELAADATRIVGRVCRSPANQTGLRALKES